MTTLRALYDGGHCWKKGDEFETHLDRDGCIFILCHHQGESKHNIFTAEGNYARTPEECTETGFEVIDEQPADTIGTDPAGAAGAGHAPSLDGPADHDLVGEPRSR